MNSKEMAIAVLKSHVDIDKEQIDALVYANQALGEWKQLAQLLFEAVMEVTNIPEGSLVEGAEQRLRDVSIEAIKRLGTIKE